MISGVAALTGAGQVHANGITRYVGPNPIGGDTSCAFPGYNSVQAAVTAANPGDTIHVCTGTYAESVVVTKNLTLIGDAGATLSTPPAAIPYSELPPQFTTDNLANPQANVVVWGTGVRVSISNLTITGPFTTNGCADDIYGILVIDGGAITVTNDQVQNIESNNSGYLGCQYGIGIQIGREYWPVAGYTGNYVTENFKGTATITNSRVIGYQKNGITIDSMGSQATVSASTITGAGQVNYIAQNGIQVSRGATGKLNNNTISGNQYTGTGFSYATGVLLFGGCGDPLVIGEIISGNRVTNNDVGIDMLNYDSTCTVPVTTATNDQATSNKASNSADTNISGFTPTQGYQSGIADVGFGDKITNNTISHAGYKFQITPSIVVIPIDTTADTDVTLSGNHFSFPPSSDGVPVIKRNIKP